MFQRLVTGAWMIAFFTLGCSAWAHEGHGHNPSQGNTATHYFTEPVHLMQFAAIAGAVLFVGWVALKWFYGSPNSKHSSQQ